MTGEVGGGMCGGVGRSVEAFCGGGTATGAGGTAAAGTRRLATWGHWRWHHSQRSLTQVSIPSCHCLSVVGVSMA